MMDATEPAIAIELERLRGTIGEGFAKVEGRLDVIRTQGGQAAKDIALQARRVDRVETRVGAVERKIMVAFGASSALGAVAGIGAAFLTR